jgi:hypothetical protein
MSELIKKAIAHEAYNAGYIQACADWDQPTMIDSDSFEYWWREFTQQENQRKGKK